MRPQERLLIRADAGVEMGAGHVMRCLAMAQAWQDGGGRAVFAAAAPPAIEARLRQEAIDVVPPGCQPGSEADAQQTIELARRQQAVWVVVDGYHFGGDYQRAIKDSGLRLMVMDDYGHSDHYWADLVLNQNPHAAETLYCKREPHTRLLLGTPYVLLRREFLRWRDWRREIPDTACKILVALGGSDHRNASLLAVEAIARLGLAGLEATVVVGPGNPHLAQLAQAAERTSGAVSLRTDVNDMSELMAWADVALVGGGSTNWEHAFMGLPSLMIVLAENQRPVVERLEALGVGVNLGDFDQLTAETVARRLKDILSDRSRRQSMSHSGRRLIDGDGAARVLMHLDGRRLRLRRAGSDDCKLLWQWANDPETRANSFSSEPIPWETHVQWLAAVLADPQCQLLLALDSQDRPIGQVRFDGADRRPVLSVSIARPFRGMGYGSELIGLAVGELFRQRPITAVVARVKPENRASIRAFQKAGFSYVGTDEARGHAAAEYVRYRDDHE